MKPPSAYQSIIATLILFAAESVYAASDFQIRPPNLDSQGRFWVYRNGTNQPPIPFAPYGWMSDLTNPAQLTQLIQIDLECREHPNMASKTGGPAERERCIRMKVAWGEATWASVAFISGPDKPPWWGETKGGRYFNLATLPRKKLVFFARGELGGESIKSQIGAIGGKPFGDSLSKPIISDELKLTKDWARYEVDLKDVPGPELSRICNGFGVLVERASQPGSPNETQFYVDDVYFE